MLTATDLAPTNRSAPWEALHFLGTRKVGGSTEQKLRKTPEALETGVVENQVSSATGVQSK